MNDPNTKYADISSTSVPFFNYHEFLVAPGNTGSTLVSQVSTQEKGPDPPSLVVNHFPNIYAPLDSELYKSTRIVRIPRAFHDKDYSYMIPQFSLYTPGDEPAAVFGEPTLGAYDGNVFGTTSKPPLVPSLLSASELEEIVQTVNGFLADAFSLTAKWTWVDNIVELLSGTLYSRLWSWLVSEPYTKRELLKLEEYIGSVNESFLSKRDPKLRLISVRESGFLSMDFQIPKPS